MTGPRTAWAQLRYRLLLRRMAGPRLLRAFARTYPDAVFVEIGANDGDKHDHLRPLIIANGWRGVLVEPVPYLFERLRANYAGVARVQFENAAIAEADGALDFYHLPEAPPDEREHLPEWYDTIGSFSRETVMRHATAIDGIAERIVETQVPTLTFESLCERHGLEQVDLVAIDTEGYDGRIIRAFPFHRYRPRLILYEHFHLAPQERAATREHLHANGYETIEEGMDTFAYRGADDALARHWRRSRPAVRGVSKHDEEGQ